MSVDDIVQLTIVVSDASLTRPGFGTPLALVSKVPAGWGSNKVRTFSKLSELTTLGFATTDAGYKLASKIKSQKPAPGSFKLAKRDTAPTHTLHLKCLSGTAGKMYAITAGVDGGPTTDLARTVPGSSSAAAEATAIAALLDAVSGINASNGNAPAVPAALVVAGAGPGRDGELTYSAVTPGAAGDGITIAHIVSGSGTALSVSVASLAISVHLHTDGGGLAISTANEVAAAILASGPASALVTATVAPLDSDGDGLCVAEGATHLAGGVDAGGPTDTIAVTAAVAGTLVNLKAWSTALFKLTDVTADPGVATDLDEALAEDGDWYGVLLDSNGKLEVEGAASWTEANGKLFAYSSSDSDSYDPASTTDVFYAMKALSYDRSFGIFNGNELLGYSAAAWMGRGFAFDPGKITWAFKKLAGVTVDKLDTGKQAALEAKNANFYVAKFGAPITWEGKLASGEYIDVTHGLDWYDAEMSIQLFATISGLPKLPFTIHGLGAIEATVRAVNKSAVRQGVLADDVNLTVTMPTLDEIDPITKAQRLLPNIEVTGTLQGAIHKTKLTATIQH